MADSDEHDVLYETETLQKDGSQAKQFWRGEVIETDQGIAHRTDSWQLKKNGDEGKHRISKPTYVEKKNVGKANETTLKEQAVAEIQSKRDKKLDRRYWPVGEEKPDFRAMPMSAKKYGVIENGSFNGSRGPKKVSFPVALQPKLDGSRMLFNGSEGWSRKLNTFGRHCWDWVLENPPTLMTEDVHLDGELMLPPDQYTFQETVSAVRTEGGNELSDQLQFYVFDVYLKSQPDMPFSERLEVLKEMQQYFSARTHTVPTSCAETHEAVLNEHGRFVADGHEGTMVRSLDGPYKDSTTRSGDLLKLKGFTDEEFVITDVHEGLGKFAGMAVIECATEDGQTFEVTPKGTEASRERMFSERDQLVGKELTVRYQNRTDDSIPRFPVGVAVRDYE